MEIDVAKCVTKKFLSMGSKYVKTLKSENQWTVLAGIVLEDNHILKQVYQIDTETCLQKNFGDTQVSDINVVL